MPIINEVTDLHQIAAEREAWRSRTAVLLHSGIAFLITA